MRDLGRLVIAASFVVIFGTWLVAQRGSKPPAQQAIDMSAQTLPQGFVPDDAEAVFRDLSPAKKDEFETTAQYEARVSKGKRQTKPLYAFAVEEEHHRVDYQYDADNQQLTAIVLSSPCVHIGYNTDCSSWALTMKTANRPEREYQASNAFGATTTITEVNENAYALFLGKKSDPGNSTSLKLQIKMAPDEAREAKPNLAMLVITGGGSDGDTLVSTGHWSLTATFSDPIGGSGNDYYLHLTLKSLWVYNKKTGKVYQKFDDFAR